MARVIFLAIFMACCLSVASGISEAPSSVAVTSQPTFSEVEPTSLPTTVEPTPVPTRRLQSVPTRVPTTLEPTLEPTEPPTEPPTDPPTEKPTEEPVVAPTKEPTKEPTNRPSEIPTNGPTRFPTPLPSVTPTEKPTNRPTQFPSSIPSSTPTNQPAVAPTPSPSQFPSSAPTKLPTNVPTQFPSLSPSEKPTFFPSVAPLTTPTTSPTLRPTLAPSSFPSVSPSKAPTEQPTVTPTASPTSFPSDTPTEAPTPEPTTRSPTLTPTTTPTRPTTSNPTQAPNTAPSQSPTTSRPSTSPSASPTIFPTAFPSPSPTQFPTNDPTKFPTLRPTRRPTRRPTSEPTLQPSSAPSVAPSVGPTSGPTVVRGICGEEFNCDSRWSFITNTTGTGLPCGDFTGSLNDVCNSADTWNPERCCVGNQFENSIEGWKNTCRNLQLTFCLTIATDAPSAAPSASPTEAPSSSPTDTPEPTPFNLGPSFCVQHSKCFASELCREDRECVGELCEDGQCDVVDAIPVLYTFVGLLMLAILLSSCYCVCHNCTNTLKPSNVQKIVVKGDEVEEQESVLWAQCRILFSESNRLAEAHSLQIQDVSSLKIKTQLESTVWTFKVVAHYLMVVAHEKDNDALIKPAEQLLNTAKSVWQAMDNSKPPQVRTREIAFAKAQLQESAKAIQAIAPNCGLTGTLALGAEHENWGLGGSSLKELETKCITFLPTWVVQDDDDTTSSATRLQQHCGFYTCLFLLYVSVFVAFAAKAGSSESSLHTDSRPGGFGNTFLNVPPQYNFEQSNIQRYTIPLVYGVMHSALMSLGLLPVPMCRVLWTKVASRWPRTKKFLPLYDLNYIHRFLGVLVLLQLSCGALLWLFVMAADCASKVTGSCLAFDPSVENFYNPFQNVILLRVVVLCTWFPIMPLITFAKKCPSVFRSLPFFKDYWFEFCYYSHVVIAFATVGLAVLFRFEVFYPVLLSWGIYICDRMFAVLTYRRVSLVEKIVFARSENGIPTSMRLKFKTAKDNFPVLAGQYIFIQVPSIDFTWHPFSLASSSSDDTLELHVGIIAEAKTWSREQANITWTTSSKTWTSSLYMKANVLNPDIRARIIGPYGTTFSSCFNARFGGSIVIGAGTGLTAAESVLRETFYRKQCNIPTPEKVWFVWSCRTPDDLLWCWNTLVYLLVKEAKEKRLNLDVLSDCSNMFDWLGITIYVTRSDSFMLQDFEEVGMNTCVYGASKSGSRTPKPEDVSLSIESGKESPEVRIKRWLMKRIVLGKFTQKKYHIRHFLNGCRGVLDETESGRNKGMAVSFCGPTALSVVVGQAIQQLGRENEIEFSSDHL